MAKFDPNSSVDGYLAELLQGPLNADNMMTEETSTGVLNGKFFILESFQMDVWIKPLLRAHIAMMNCLPPKHNKFEVPSSGEC